MSGLFPKRVFSKSKLSMYLRTLCDRELYLSLFSNNPKDLEAAGIPVPLKSRPGVQLITASGREFEYEQYDILCSSLPNHVIANSNGHVGIDLASALASATGPALILQPEIEPETFRTAALTNFGVAAADLPFIPQLAGLRPDVVFVDHRRDTEFEILPDGTRRQLADDDKRLALSVIDLKNITEANASYSAEVCLYAIFLSNWLALNGGSLKQQFFVSDRVYLWRHVEMPAFTKILGSAAGGNHDKRLDALREDLEDGLVLFLIYMPSVRKFFCEDLPRAVRLGDQSGWSAVPYHVNQKCGSCDWLGNRLWLSPDDQKHFDAHPDHYCVPNATSVDHLCRLPTLSKGATNVLVEGGHSQVASLIGLSPSASVLRGHTLLKKDRTQLGDRAEALSTGQTTVDTASQVGGLAKYFDAEFDLVVNFDSGSGFLTGIALRGVLFAPYGSTFPATASQPAKSFVSLGESAFVVGKDTIQAEWAALLTFIDTFASLIESADKQFTQNGFGKVHTQICFWEPRQYEELCNAFGRHLLNVLSLAPRYQRALAWIFPAEELLEKTDQVCPNIVFIQDIVTGYIRIPQSFAVTLLGTVKDYHHPNLQPRAIDNYYVEPLGNGIPRERIFEIWKSPTGTVKMFGKPILVSDAIDRYGKVLKAHAWAIASITARLRTDLKANIRGKAPELSMSIPAGLTSVAYDSKLWDRWTRISASVAKTEAIASLIARPETLEASYKAIILTKVPKSLGGHRYQFEIGEDSTEAKIDEGDICIVGIVGWPGFPMASGQSLGITMDAAVQYSPIHRILSAHLEKFDRMKREVVVRFQPTSTWSPIQTAFDDLMASGQVPVGTSRLYLIDRMPYDDSEETTDILREIGNPKCAAAAPEALIALGHNAAKKIPAGTDADTLVAEILWRGNIVSKKAVRPPQDVTAIVTFAKGANSHPLNASQIDAVEACARQQLTVVWGPPGTGKTDTLVAFLHSVARQNLAKKIAISGPNYRTVEELSERLVRNLENDNKVHCDYFWLYSKSRQPKSVSTSTGHLNLKAVRLDTTDPGFQDLLSSLADPNRVTIISSSAHNFHKLAKAAGGGTYVAEIFDLVVLDESSQTSVTLALRPLGTLKSTGQAVIAGDHKQMPPIELLEPPLGAEHLVGGIQQYLVRRFGLQPLPLLINYRSNSDLVDYAKSLGYPAKLQAAHPDRQVQLITPIADVVKTLPASLPITAAYAEMLEPGRRVNALIHDDPISSQANMIEAGLVAGLAYVARHALAKELYDGTAVSVS